MNPNYARGRLANLLFYVFESVITIIYILVKGEFPAVVTGCIFLYLVATCTFLMCAPNRIQINPYIYCRIQIILFMILAILLCFTYQSAHIFIYTMYLRILIAFLYIDDKLCRFQTLLTMTVSILFWMTDFCGLPNHPTSPEMTLALLSMYAACWMLTNFARILTFEQRKSLEQERSLDDLLKVVETKCDEAQNATRIKSEFLSNMSHEIRTPINTILGMNEMILRETTNSDIHQYAGNVENAGKMLLSLINDILDFSKIESGKMEIIPVKYQISSVLNDLINMLKPKADTKGLNFDTEINPNIPNLLKGDEVRIRQIATNLLTNAIKYTDEGTITLISTFKLIDSNHISLYLAVRDTGKGIREEDIPKLFSSFQRVDQKQNRNIEGTGLGLSITRHLVELMGGTIGVESTYGEGSLFYVTIPQTIADHKPIGRLYQHIDYTIPHKYKEAFTAPQAHILVVDDNSMNLAVVTGLLKKTLIQIDTASNGRECIQKLRENNYHLVLLDHMMPDMDGIETLQQMKAEHLADDMPVIALTANAISGAREMYLDYGFQDYLSKPIAGDSLENILLDWLPKEVIHPSSITDTSKEPENNDSNPYTDLEERICNTTEDSSSDFMVLDKNTALNYCANDETLYQQMLSLYTEQGLKYLEQLEQYYNLKDWTEYCTIVHAIKSTSKTIGAINFAEFAYTLEQAARESNEEVLTEKNPEFLNNYRLLIKKSERNTITVFFSLKINQKLQFYR